MTEKISAGYFDSNRGEPIYVGDVYKEAGAMIPYHKVIKDPDKGFMVEHVGTTEKFSLTSEAKNLIKKEYLGNIYDTPDWDELVGHKKSDSETQEVKDEPLPENTPEDVRDFLEGKTDELPEGTETISTAESEGLEKQAKEIEKTTDENNSEAETPEDTDAVVSPDATTGPKDEPKAEDNKEESTENQEEKTEEKQETKATPEVIANSKEEKNLLEKRNDYQRHIDSLKRKNDELETEAVRYENLASTLTFEPFVELKILTSNAVQDYAKRQDIKECEKHLKNYKTIDSVEALLKEYKDMAEKNRANIELNNKDIDNYEVKLTEIQDKLRAFQTKLPLDLVTQPENTTTEEVKTEDSQPEPTAESENEVKTDTDVKADSEEKSENPTNTETVKEESKDAESGNDEDVPF